MGEIDESEWDKILEEVDLDGNGEISFDEFKEMIYKLFGIEREKIEVTPGENDDDKINDDKNGGLSY